MRVCFKMIKNVCIDSNTKSKVIWQIILYSIGTYRIATLLFQIAWDFLILLIATLLQDQCEIEIEATTSNGYSSGLRFILSLYAEDHSRDPVELTKPHTSVTTGPFSRVPIKVKKANTNRMKYIENRKPVQFGSLLFALFLFSGMGDVSFSFKLIQFKKISIPGLKYML